MLEVIAQQMRPGGLHYLGGVEMVMGVTAHFTAGDGERGVFERQATLATVRPMVAAR